jgi:hypothetical protein
MAGAIIPAQASLSGVASSTNNYNSGGNNIYITVQDGEDLLRTLRRMGMRLV